MKSCLFLIIPLCAFTAALAMVPRERPMGRQVENVSHTRNFTFVLDSNPPNATSETGKVYPEPNVTCASYTPCAWQIYNRETENPETLFINHYCKCAEGQVCQAYKDDKNVFTIVLRCQEPDIEYVTSDGAPSTTTSTGTSTDTNNRNSTSTSTGTS